MQAFMEAQHCLALPGGNLDGYMAFWLTTNFWVDRFARGILRGMVLRRCDHTRLIVSMFRWHEYNKIFLLRILVLSEPDLNIRLETNIFIHSHVFYLPMAHCYHTQVCKIKGC